MTIEPKAVNRRLATISYIIKKSRSSYPALLVFLAGITWKGGVAGWPNLQQSRNDLQKNT